ncbi:MAG: ZIP family metal transporter [Acidimicrobiales bacterium]
MSFVKTVVLGFIAGATIVAGLPIGRLRKPAERVRSFLNAVAIGVLLFLVVDVFSNAYAPIKDQLQALHDHRGGSVATTVTDVVLLLGGAAVGLLSLALYQRWSRRGRAATPSTPASMSVMIASGIGLHNFGEGLAIGTASHLGAIGLSTVLVIGFALHNATEGFGIVSPLVGATNRPSWAFLGLMALIGGGPTTVGTLVGWWWSSPTLGIVFLSLAGGSIIFVISQLLFVAGRSRHQTTVFVGITIGLLAGFLTDIVVAIAGG